MLRNCPNLRICSANFVANGSNILVLPNLGLQTISIYGNDGITDGHIKAMVNNLTSLRVLNILNCNALTDLSLQHIAEHVGGRLETLYVDIKHPESTETEAILEIFSQKCTNLKYLNIDCGDDVLCMGKGTSALVCGCPALRTLVVNKASTIGPTSRALVAKFRPDLTILVYEDTTESLTD